jgi:hypothetical protein
MAINRAISRRALLTSAASCAAAGLVQTSLMQKARAQNTPVAAGASAEQKIWSQEYWAKKGDVSLYLFRKRKGESGRRSRRASNPVSRAWLVGFFKTDFRSYCSRP